MRRIIIWLSLILISSVCYAATFEKLFYITNDVANSTRLSDEKLAHLNLHANAIDVIAPQIYQLHADGIVWGVIDPMLVKFANTNHIKLMPLITNSNFDQDEFHRFLTNSLAQERAVAHLLRLCSEYSLYGIQFDFENVHVNDKNAFTHFVEQAADELHHHGFKLSIAIVPHSAEVARNEYDAWFYENWSGAYDYQKLGQSADFLTLMSYDRHTSLTTPGPIAALDWVDKTLKLILQSVPANKVSLGIPVYSGYWVNGQIGADKIPLKYSFRPKELQITYNDVASLLTRFHQTLSWNAASQSAYLMFSNHDKNEYLFVENSQSFAAKVALAKRYHLHGISVWKFGMEDPAIWSTLP